MGKNKEIKISKAKGRPMLTWVGKRPLTSVRAYPAQHVESFAIKDKLPLEECDWSDWPEKFDKGGLLFHGDNKDVLAYLLANGFRGKVKLIYIDPPFDSGADYVRKVQLRGISGSQKIDGEEYTLGEQIQYTDIWAKDNYLQFMFERLLFLKELLSAEGSLYLHCDWNKSHYLRILLAEIFGEENIRNEIIWKRTSARSDSKTYNHIHDTIYFVTKGKDFIWNKQHTDYSDEYIKRYFTMVDSKTNKRFQGTDLTARGLRKGSTGQAWRGFDPGSKGNHWKYTIEKLNELDDQGMIYWPDGGGWPRYKHYLDEARGLALQSIWNDLFVVNSQAIERTDYPTQKPESLMERIIKSSSNVNDIILDSFIGSGSTVSTAQQLGRRWIGCDINKGSIQITARRLQTVMQEQAESLKNDKQQSLVEGENAPVKPCQLSFSTWRVNDYDLQIQHNEALDLACEYIGITRNRSDGFFDGSRGKRLAKIISFNHPLTPLDLEAIRNELERRPEEERDIEIVCLGMELTAQAWLENYNRNRPVNKFHLIELRTDNKYGGFIKHEPLTASIKIKRKGDKVLIDVNDVYSPSIVKRLNMEQGLFKAQIEDWRAVVDCIMIDMNYDGQVFNVVLSDVPAKKTDLVKGQYELPAPPKDNTVAVKIIDMLGEEIIITKKM